MVSSSQRVTALGLAVALFGCDGAISDPGVRGGVARPSGGVVRPSGGGVVGSGGGGGGNGGGPGVPRATPVCGGAVVPGRAPVRRLTRFEFNNTIADLVGDTTQPGNALPPEDQANGFGNDAARISVSDDLPAKYFDVAEGIALRATQTPAQLTKLAACAASATGAAEEPCARTIIDGLLPRVYRRPAEAGESDAHLALFRAVRAKSPFASSVAAVISAMLQSPDFLYRVEQGAPDAANPMLTRPTGFEMAARLSYMFWGTTPDDGLRGAAASGALLTAAGIQAQAERLLADPRSHVMVSFFFDSLLPINALPYLARDPMLFPTFSPAIGALMHQETQRFLEYSIFDAGASWSSILTAPYTFVNADLAKYYGLPAVTGTTFQKVDLDTTKRLGLLTQPGLLAGLIPADNSNPVARGGFLVRKMLCRSIPLPSGDILAQVKVPDPYSGPTARDRFSQHSKNAVCAACHMQMDPIGFAMENFDPVGLWRDNEGTTKIDASGAFPGTGAAFNGPTELAQLFAASDDAQSCFATHWTEFAYGLTLGSTPDDACAQEQISAAFQKSGGNVKQLFIDLTQTYAFQYLPAVR